MTNQNPPHKNIVYDSTIIASGNVHIGDIIYQVERDFQHSILFFRIEPMGNGEYSAQLTLKSRHVAQAGLPLLKENIQFSVDPELFQQVADFQELRRLDDATFRNLRGLNLDASRLNETQLGQNIFNAFFTDDLLAVCRDFVALLEKRKIEELILAISTADTAVLNLPFEMAIPHFFLEKFGVERQSLAVAHFGLVRTMEPDLPKFDMQGKPASAVPLKMLFVTALPENMNERAKLLEIEEEQKRLIDAIGSFEATGGAPKIVIEFLDTASLAEISEALRKHQHEIVHISGHGSYQKDVKRGVLHLEDEDGNHLEVLGKQLGETLRQHQCVKLLILSACETAVAGDGVVEQLAEFGLPSMVAMRFSVTDIGAKVFTTALYEALSKGETLTHALANARESLWAYVQRQRRLDPHRIHLAEWFTPVVYLNQYTEALVNLKATYVLPKDFYPHSDFFKTKNTRLIGSGFIGRKRYLNQLRRSFAQGRHVVLHGLGGMGKTTLAEAFAHNYGNRSHEVIIFRNGPQISEKYILDELFARLEADEKANKNTVRQIKQYLESDANPQEKLQALIDNSLRPRKTILIFDNFEDVQKSEGGELGCNIGSAGLAAFLQHLCQNSPENCHLLFTTRYVIGDLKAAVLHLALDKMSYAESYRLSNFSPVLRTIPLAERQDVFKRLDGHPRAYEFLETILKNDSEVVWSGLAASIGDVEAQVWERLLLEKIYALLAPEAQGLLQMASVCFTRTPIAALAAISGQEEATLLPLLESLHEWSLCFWDAPNRQFEVHRLTREWMRKNVVSGEEVKKWAFAAGSYFKENTSLDNYELAKDYFELAEAWTEFAEFSFRLEGHYDLIGFYQKAFELNQAVLDKNIDEKTNARALNGIGVMYIRVGDYETALRYLEQSLAIAQQIGDRSGEGGTLSNISQIYATKGDYEMALRYLEQSLAIAQQIGNRLGEGTTLNNISQIYDAKGDYETALHYLEQSLAIAQQIGDRSGEGAALNNIATTAYGKGDYETALRYLEQSLAILQQIGNRSGEGMILNNISQIHKVRGDYATALRYLEQSLAIQQQIGNRSGEGTTLHNISQIHKVRGDYDTALRYLEQSLAIAQQIGDRSGESSTLNNISLIYSGKGDYETALRYLEQSLAIVQQIGDIAGLAAPLNNISQIYSTKGDYETALRYLEQSLAILQQIGDIAGLATTLHNKGAIYWNQKNEAESAIQAFMTSYQIFQKIGSPNVQLPESYLNAILEHIGEARFLEIVAQLPQP
ncbi:MAG: tetratricopeptide repeat protein [Saprospiraceae bacterium]